MYGASLATYFTLNQYKKSYEDSDQDSEDESEEETNQYEKYQKFIVENYDELKEAYFKPEMKSNENIQELKNPSNHLKKEIPIDYSPILYKEFYMHFKWIIDVFCKEI